MDKKKALLFQERFFKEYYYLTVSMCSIRLTNLLE